MKVVFLCGGVGKRMSPISEDKFLLKFVGRKLLEHQIETAKSAGLSQFIIVGNPQNIGDLEDTIKTIPDARFELVVQKEPRGIADALLSAEHLLDGEVLVQSSNDIIEPSAYTSLFQLRDGDPASSYLLACKVQKYFPGGYLVIDDDSNLVHIVEKPRQGQEPSDLVNILFHLHTSPGELLSYAEMIETAWDDVYERALDTLAAGDRKIKIVPYTGSWLTIKYPWHILSVVHHFLDRNEGYISPSAQISGRATLEGKVIIGDNVRIMENAVIKGPAYIGQNSVIGTGSIIRDYAHIGEGCIVGYSTEIKSSYIGDNCQFHMSYVGDSIVGDGCSFGAGTVLGNLRFDERNICVRTGDEVVDTGLSKLGAIIGEGCRTGINVSVMPGTRIGPNSIVGPHVCLTRDLPPGKFAIVEPGYRVVDNRTQGIADMGELAVHTRNVAAG